MAGPIQSVCLTTRQRTVLRMLVTYAFSNLDDINEALEAEEKGLVKYAGILHRKMNEAELNRL